MKRDPARILLLVDGLAVGGAERQAVELLKGLARSGRFAPVLGVLDRGGELEAEAAESAVEVLALRRRARFDCTPAIELIGHTRRARVRLIQAQGWMSGLAALVAARCLGLPVVNASLRNAPTVPSARERLARWSALRSDAAVVNGVGQLHAFGLDGKRQVRVIPNGVDLDRFERIAPDGGGATICMVANFSGYKDHSTLIRALPLIRAAIPEARMTLVGRDEGTLAAARRLVEELGLGGAVRFVTDSAHPEPFIAGSAVGVLSTYGEGLSNALLEYMALAKPVVASDCPGNQAIVHDGENGFIVPQRSPESLAARVTDLLRDSERARVMGARGRARVEESHSLDRMVADYERLYDELVPAP